MKLKLRWLLLLFPLALLAWAYHAASWRPKLVGAQPIFGGKGLKLMQYGPGARLLIAPDGEHLASSGLDNKSSFVMGWNIAARKAQWRVDEGFYNVGMGALAYSPDGRTLAVSVDEGVFGRPNFVIDLVETATGKRRRLMKISWQTILQDAAFLSNRELVISTFEGALVVDVQTGVTIRQWKFKLPVSQIKSRFSSSPQIQISADGTAIIALSNGDTQTAIAVYDAQTGQRRGVWTYHSVFRNPRLSPDGKFWVVDKGNDRTDIYDARTGAFLWSNLAGGADFPCTWSADSSHILSSQGDATYKYDARDGHQLGQLPGAPFVRALALDSKGDYFYTLDDKGKIWRWRAR